MASASDTILEDLRDLANQHFGLPRDRLQLEATLRDVGIDSFQFIELVFLAEDRFGISVDLAELDVRTVGDVVLALEQLIAGRREPALRSVSLEK